MMRKITLTSHRLILTCTLIFVVLSEPAILAQGSIFGTVTNSDATIPSPGEISFFGYLDDTDEEIRIESSIGAGYDGGTWYDDFQNYKTETPGNPYDYHFHNSTNGEGFVLSKLIPNNSFQQEDITLAEVLWPDTPTGLTGYMLTPTSAFLSWNSRPELTYHVYRRSANSDGSFFRIDDPAGSLSNPGVSGNSFVDNTVDGIKNYDYLLVAEDASGNLSPHSHIFTYSYQPNPHSILLVPIEYPTIQDAINAALGNDTVLVAADTYIENINFIGKRIVVTSVNGPSSTVIQAVNSDIAVVSIINNEPKGTEISGFTITGSNNSGVFCVGSSPTVKGNIISGNSSSGTNNGGAIDLNNTSYSLIYGNILHNNTASVYGAGIHMENCSEDTIAYNILYMNQGYGEIRGMNSTAYIFNNTISVTTSEAFQAREGGHYDIRNNIIFFAKTTAVYANFSEGCTINAEYNCTFNNNIDYNFTPGIGNIYEYAEFVDSANHDYNLNPGSPCINAGDPDPEYNDPDGTRNDMGAIPFWSYRPEILGIYLEGHDTPTNIIDNYPRFDWIYNDQTGENPQTHFEIAVGTDNDWQYAEMWNPAPIATSDTFTTYAGAPLIDGETYFARLKIQNYIGWSAWYEISFRMNSVPSVPVNKHPIGDTVIDNPQPTLYVNNSSDAEGDALTYDFEVFDDFLGCYPVTSVYGIEEQPDSTGWQVDVILGDNFRFLWKTRSFDGYEYSGWTELDSFWVNSVEEYPSAFEMIFPPDTGWSQVYVFPVLFWWNESFDNDPFDSVFYKLQISLDSEFTFVATYDSLYYTCCALPGFAILIDLEYGTRYWWKVEAFDTKGNITPGGDVADFLTWVLGDANADGATNVGDAVFLMNLIFHYGPMPDPPQIGDANGDCCVNIGDVVYLLNHIFDNGPAPVVGCWPCELE